MFGIVRPCRHRLGESLTSQWMAHLCGLCLALRKDHGQFARITVRLQTNIYGGVQAVLVVPQALLG
ncbi:DUF5685 family protein, partial [Streptomyces violaceoruber]